MSLDDRLRNWAWYVSGSVIPQPDSTCRSFEKNYIPELGNLYAPEEPHYEPDNRDGEIIEEAIKGLPLELRKILKAQYVSHPYASQNQLAHHLRISTKRFETDLHNAKKRLQDQLDKKAKSNHYANLLKVSGEKDNGEWNFRDLQSWD
jgi:DNA-directed RNA polymerase specialized sigma24 family protein